MITGKRASVGLVSARFPLELLALGKEHPEPRDGLHAGFFLCRARLRTISCSLAARCASSMAESVCVEAAASELAMEIRPNRRLPITHGRSSGSNSAHSIGSFKVS